jgi:carboxypeptidase D
LCGYDLNFTYPQRGKFPTLQFVPPPILGGPPVSSQASSRLLTKRGFEQEVAARFELRNPSDLHKRTHLESREEREELWKRDLSERPGKTLDPWYGCDLFDEMIDYAVNYSYPWSECLWLEMVA